jgi:hypothetical protein
MPIDKAADGRARASRPYADKDIFRETAQREALSCGVPAMV